VSTEFLYPFQHAARGDPAALFADVVRSTREKIVEIGVLRSVLLAEQAGALAACAEALAARFARGGRLFAFGNGGSSTDAMAVADLHVDPGAGRRPLPAVALPADVATLTALANDVGFDVVFSRPLTAAARPEDIAMGLSTSGGSRNVLQALAAGHEHGLLTIGLAGHRGGPMSEAAEHGLVDHLFVVPSASVHRIQEAQTTIYQVLWELVQTELAQEPGKP
jgi:D-sedoheptulose 7-phosphate isomerase